MQGAKTIVEEKPKVMRQAKESILKEWDVSFAINSEVLVNILRFMTDINTDILFKFYEDRIIIHQKSPDNIQFGEVEISSEDILDYKPLITGDPNRKDAKFVLQSSEGSYKAVLIDVRGTLDEIETFSSKNSVVIVRIDTFYYKRIEFHCSASTVVWAQLVDPAVVLKSVEKLPGVVKRVREDSSIEKAIVTVEPATFISICNIGGKDKKRDIDKRTYIGLDNKDGLFITSGDKLKGRYFELKPVDVGVQFNDYSEFVTGTEEIDSDNVVSNSENIFSEDDGFTSEDKDFIASSESSDSVEGPGSFAIREDNSNKEVSEDKVENKPVTNQLLSIDADIFQHVYIERDFILPFTKLKGLSPIIIEIRTNKPVVLEQRPYNGIRALLTVAPRIEPD